jgi:polyphosphate glucokinase
MQILGVDIGGSGIKGAVVDTVSGLLITERHRIPTPQSATPEAVAATLAQLVVHFDWTGLVGCGFPSAIQHGVARTIQYIAIVYRRRYGQVVFDRCGCSGYDGKMSSALYRKTAI